MRSLGRTASVLGLFVSLVVLTGCSDGPKIVSVSGTLTREGKPVPNLTINFVPAVGRPSWAVSDENGRFTAQYDKAQEGVIVGTHTVWVVWRPSSPKEEMDIQSGKASRPANYKAITEKFGSEEKTPLKFEITKAESNLEIKLD